MSSTFEEIKATLSFEPEGTIGSSGLAGSMAAAGYDRRINPAVEVPFKVFQPLAAVTFSGDYADAVPSVKTSPPLGADSRFLYPSLRRERVAADETSVISFRQKSRTLPDAEHHDPDDRPGRREARDGDGSRGPLGPAARDRDGRDRRAEHLPRVGRVQVLDQRGPDLRVQLGGRRACDRADRRAEPRLGRRGSRHPRGDHPRGEEVARHGYSPSVVAAAPEDLIGLTLLKQPTSGDYVFSHGGDMPLQGLRRVAVSGLATPFVLDPTSLGTLFMNPVRIASFEEEAGSTNTSTVRIEATGVFIVQRILAVAEAVVGS